MAPKRPLKQKNPPAKFATLKPFLSKRAQPEAKQKEPEPAKQKDGAVSSAVSEAEKKRLRRRDSDLLLVRHVWTVFADSRFRRRLLARLQVCGASDAGRNGA